MIRGLERLLIGFSVLLVLGTSAADAQTVAHSLEEPRLNTGAGNTVHVTDGVRRETRRYTQQGPPRPGRRPRRRPAPSTESPEAVASNFEAPSKRWTVLGGFGSYRLQGGSSVGGPFGTLHLGGGGEFVGANGLGMAVDAGYVGDLRGLGGALFFSPGMVYDFRTARRYRPYVRGGYTALLSEGPASMVHIGGGINYWFTDRHALKLEVRDHIFAGGDPEEFNLLEFSLGLAFGWS